MSTTSKNYYATELAKLNADKYGQSFKMQLTSLDGKTKWLSIDKEAATEVATFLNDRFVRPLVTLHYDDFDGKECYFTVRDVDGVDPIGEAITLDDAYLADKRVVLAEDGELDRIIEEWLPYAFKVAGCDTVEDARLLCLEVIRRNYHESVIYDGSFFTECLSLISSEENKE